MKTQGNRNWRRGSCKLVPSLSPGMCFLLRFLFHPIHSSPFVTRTSFNLSQVLVRLRIDVRTTSVIQMDSEYIILWIHHFSISPSIFFLTSYILINTINFYFTCHFGSVQPKPTVALDNNRECVSNSTGWTWCHQNTLLEGPSKFFGSRAALYSVGVGGVLRLMSR